MITIPFNFVPLNKEIFYPNWSDSISHDIPFSDGESEMINIKITAETAIFIRNHYIDGDKFYLNKKGDKVSMEFCHIKNTNGGKQYYIPGTSMKGMIRNVVEIMSFSKINVDEKILKKPLSVRDMTPKQYCANTTIKKMKDCPKNLKRNLYSEDIVATATKCAFLIKKNNKFFIEDCGNIINIDENEIQSVVSNYNKNIKTAKEKYEQFGYNDFSFRKENRDRRTVAIYSQNGSSGSLVMTGFIDNKKYEFIFKKNGKKIPLKNSLYEDFKKVYFDNKNAIDGQYWKKEWDNGEGRKIPVFYVEDSERKITAIGLTQIFKLSYKKTLFDTLYQKTDNKKIDLAESIFGTVRDNHTLKGRVQFSHFKSSHVTFEKEKKGILGSPQATYYPNYLRQTDVNGDRVNTYKTLMDNLVEASGYKRYPLHRNIKKSFIADEEKTDIQTKFKPLNTNTIFNGKLRFHNLKKAEIGSLLSALTFHGNSDYRHNIGMAKALGYGKIKIELNIEQLKYSLEEYLKAYENEMTLAIDNWIETPQLKELFAIGNNKILNDKNLEYQKLENPTTRDKEKNDFVRAKKNRWYLKNYSDIGNVELLDIGSYACEEEMNIRRKELQEIEWKKIINSSDKIAIKKLIDSCEELIYIKRATRKIEEIEIQEKEDKDKAEEKKTEQDSIDEWSRIVKNRKYLTKERVEKFIKDFPNSPKTSEAKKELDSLSKPKDASEKSVESLASAKDGKEFKYILEKLNIFDEDKDKIKSYALSVYRGLNKKKKKNFFKGAQLARFMDKEFEDDIKRTLKLKGF